LVGWLVAHPAVTDAVEPFDVWFVFVGSTHRQLLKLIARRAGAQVDADERTAVQTDTQIQMSVFA